MSFGERKGKRGRRFVASSSPHSPPTPHPRPHNLRPQCSDARAERQEEGNKLASLLAVQSSVPLPVSFGRPCIICGSSSGACATCTGCGAPYHATCAAQQALHFAFPYPKDDDIEGDLGGNVRLTVEQRGSWIVFEGLCGTCRKKKDAGGGRRSMVKVEAETKGEVDTEADMDIDEGAGQKKRAGGKEHRSSWARCEPATVTVLFGVRRRLAEEASADLSLYASEEAKGWEEEENVPKGKGKDRGRGKGKGKKRARGRGKSGKRKKDSDSFSASELRKVGVEWMESGELFGEKRR